MPNEQRGEDGKKRPQECSSAEAAAVAAPIIYQLSVTRFRGIKSLRWTPGKSVNVLLGGGDVGKTTILDAIGLLFSPTNQMVISDTDYYGRDTSAGFSIEAIVALPPEGGIYDQSKPSWPWAWNGSEAIVPDSNGEADTSGTPVFRFRVRGTEDLDLAYEIVQPDDSADTLTQTMRRKLGVVRLSGDDRNDRDLRLVQGSALDRLLSDKSLRSRLTTAFAKSAVVRDELTEGARELLTALDADFQNRSLPSGLDLELTGSQGAAITALVGLTAQRENVPLPVASWGSGTRRLAALAVAEHKQGESPITLVDEIERGLEPYRQRGLMAKLLSGQSQAFVTTHSPAAIAAAAAASLWYVDHLGNVGALDPKKTRAFRARDPEMFLARLTIVAEGATEVGFLRALLGKALPSPLEQYGIHLADGNGHEATLGLLEALAAGGLAFGGFVDEERGQHADRWRKVQDQLAERLFRWKSGCIEQNIVAALSDDQLEELVRDPREEKTGKRLRTLMDRLGNRDADKEFATVRRLAGTQLRALLLDAALGHTAAELDASKKKEFRAHAQDWFKTIEGGGELEEKMFRFGIWPKLKVELLPFCNAVRKAVGLSEVAELTA
ncbi:MAG: AAA family ATPase [Polyangiaceae bacterium]|jgi:putative ATP-dependent endonuclease of OLD family